MEMERFSLEVLVTHVIRILVVIVTQKVNVLDVMEKILCPMDVIL
jgi:hypothetical protein